jgi:hypothetical protein
MARVWTLPPMNLGLLLVAFLLVLVLGAVVYLKNRRFRNVERLALIEKGGTLDDYSLARKLLVVVPWNFSLGLAVLVVLLGAAAFFDDPTRGVLIELSKVVTGAVLGSLFRSTASGVESGSSSLRVASPVV